MSAHISWVTLPEACMADLAPNSVGAVGLAPHARIGVGVGVEVWSIGYGVWGMG